MKLLHTIHTVSPRSAKFFSEQLAVVPSNRMLVGQRRIVDSVHLSHQLVVDDGHFDYNCCRRSD